VSTIATANALEVPLRDAVDATLAFNRERRLLSVDRNAAWQVAHGAVAYGQQLQLQVEQTTVPALEYLFGGGEMRGWMLSLGPVLPKTGRPSIRAFVEAGSYVGQGHVDQFLGYLSQNPLPRSTPITVDGRELTLEDWGRTAQWEIPNNPYLEYSWTLIALTNLFPDEYEWQASDGKSWTLEPLVEFEAKQDIGASPCGGMHRLMGLAHSVRYWKRRGLSLKGGWQLADQVVADAVQSIRRYQNADGTFSTNYTVRPGMSSDLSTRIGTTGHTLEFLAYALEPEQLREPWMERAVERLCGMLDAASEVELECGGLYHGLGGLKLYRERRWPANDTASAAP
jgi:hypothetical protein